MKTFLDELGEEWSINLTVGSLRNIRDLHDVDLLNKPEELPSEIETMIDLIHCSLRGQIAERKLSLQQFCERLAGDCLADAINAFVEELCLFFSSFQKSRGQAMSLIWEQAKTLDETQAKGIENLFGSTSIAWPELSE